MIIELPKYFSRKDMRFSGIYFLIKKGKVVYIGKSIDVLCRAFFGGHRIHFDSVRVIKCDPKRLSEYERRLIIIFRPKHNKAHLYSWTGGWHEKRVRRKINVGINYYATLKA